MSEAIQMEARVSQMNQTEERSTMTLKFKGCFGVNDVLTIPAREGVSLGDRFVVVMSKVDVELVSQ